MTHLKPLDIVRTKVGGHIGLVEQVDRDGAASLTFLGAENPNAKSAWWDPAELKLIDTLPRWIARATANPAMSYRAEPAIEAAFGLEGR